MSETVMPEDFPRIDAIRALEKAGRQIDRFLPPGMEAQRAEILQHLNAALVKLGRVDDHRICRRCGRSFIWTVQQQERFAAGKLSPPRHCKECRMAHIQAVWGGNDARRLGRPGRNRSRPNGRGKGC